MSIDNVCCYRNGQGYMSAITTAVDRSAYMELVLRLYVPAEIRELMQSILRLTRADLR